MPTKFLAALLSLFLLLCLCGSPAQAQLGSSGFFLSQGSACSYPLPIGSDIVASAYGLRLLRAAYATPTKIVRVQRASDNTQTDIGVAANSCDLDSSAFTTFCNATTCSVAKWYDQSGNGADISQATLANMPVLLLNQKNGHPAMTFNGTSQILIGTTTISVAAATWAAVALNGPSFAALHYIGSIGTVSNNTGIETGTTNPQCTAAKNVTGPAKVGQIACSVSTWYRWIGTLNTNLVSLYINGTKGTDDVSSQAPVGQTAISIGAAVAGSPILYWAGSISEVILFAPDISISDSNTLTANQGIYWGI